MPRDPDIDKKHSVVPIQPPRQPHDEDNDHASTMSSPLACAPHRQHQNDALRAWFHSDTFNCPDGLDDYDQDFCTFDPLKEIITSDMRHHLERHKQLQGHEPDRRKTNPASPDAMNQRIDVLPNPIAEFENLRFISEAPHRCAHRRSRFRGCKRCISSCPADAVRSKGDAVEIDHDLCQECGLCAAVCPTGALCCGFVQHTEMLARIRKQLKNRQSAEPNDCVVVFHEPQTGSGFLDQIRSEWSGTVIEQSVEDIASIGMEIWLAALAYGAAQVILAPSPQTTPGILRHIRTRLDCAALILRAMGHSGEGVILPGKISPQKHVRAEPAAFPPMADSSRLMRFAIQHLYEQGSRARAWVSLPAGSPFGTVRIDKSACTLCLACAQVCPTAALSGGGDQPQIKMTEARCIQCDLCRQACPENAIRLETRMLFERRRCETSKVLNQEKSFNCIGCGNPFAPASLIERMADRLDGHWMYRSQQERRRLKMCSDCRLKEIFNHQHLEKIR